MSSTFALFICSKNFTFLEKREQGMTEWNKISAGLVTTSAITTTVYDRCGETRCSLSFIFFFFSIRRVDWWHLHAHAPPEVAIKCNQIGNRISNQRFCPKILLYARHDFPSPKLCRANIYVLFAFLVPSFFERRTSRVTSAFAYFKTSRIKIMSKYRKENDGKTRKRL